MIQKNNIIDNPIWTCDEIEDFILGVKLQKFTPADNFESLNILYVLVDGENKYSILKDVYDTILKLMNK